MIWKQQQQPLLDITFCIIIVCNSWTSLGCFVNFAATSTEHNECCTVFIWKQLYKHHPLLGLLKKIHMLIWILSICRYSIKTLSTSGSSEVQSSILKLLWSVFWYSYYYYSSLMTYLQFVKPLNVCLCLSKQNKKG